MTRWTETPEQAAHVQRISDQVRGPGVIVVTLIDGRVVSGELMSTSNKSNAAYADQPLRFNADIDVWTEERRETFDLMDIVSVERPD